MEQKQPVLSIKNVSKHLGKRKILSDITLDVHEGEIFGFLGPNGSGKTTTIKLILGLLRMESGQISICGHDNVKDFEAAMRCVGGIIENPEMYKYLTGRQNLEQYLRMYPELPGERIDEVIRLVRMESRINDKISKYSLGMRQRLGIAQAVLHHPKLLILDEPTNGLDPAGIKELRDVLKTLSREEGVAVFVSSHMLSELQLMCDRVGIIDRGVTVGFRSLDAQGMIEESEFSHYTLETPDGEKAMQLLAAGVLCQDVAYDGALSFDADHQSIPDLLSLLCREGVRVYGLTRQKKSLEDTFLEMTDIADVGTQPIAGKGKKGGSNA
ncbi:MAG: ABC transporter ATP-binding protein [Ruminococcaceae bacterium]|nr:ABC transporter ATP-binding protein [Oscillospiraceae bacterium]